jgi:hypothetical protein
VSAFRSPSLWIVAAVLIFLLWAFFAALTATQLTSEEDGHKLLRRSTAELTDIDASLPKIEADVRVAAESQPEGGTVRVPGYPIAIDLPREEALTLSREALRDRLLDESARAIYEDGMSVWTGADPEASQDIDRFSPAGAVYTGLSFVRDSVNTVFFVFAALIGLLVLALLVVSIVFLPRESWLIVLGGVALIAALPSLATAVAIRFAFRTTDADGDPFVEEMLEIGADATLVPITNFFILTALGAGLLVLGGLYLWWEARAVHQGDRLADT